MIKNEKFINVQTITNYSFGGKMKGLKYIALPAAVVALLSQFTCSPYKKTEAPKDTQHYSYQLSDGSWSKTSIDSLFERIEAEKSADTTKVPHDHTNLENALLEGHTQFYKELIPELQRLLIP